MNPSTPVVSPIQKSTARCGSGLPASRLVSASARRCRCSPGSRARSARTTTAAKTCVDEHAQPGTGSTDLFGGLAALHLLDKRSALFASIQYRHTGQNDFDYRYGRIFLANLAYERKLGGRLDGVVELNYRFAGKDRDGSEELPNIGGSVLYLTPRLLVDLGGGIVLRGAVQVPFARDLNGAQAERAVFNLGLSFLFGTR